MQRAQSRAAQLPPAMVFLGSARHQWRSVVIMHRAESKASSRLKKCAEGTRWRPSLLAKLVNITPISLWFLLVIYRIS